MPLRYGSLHGRLFRVPQQRWLTFPQEQIRAIRGYYEVLCSTNTDPSFLYVLERSCDQCAATFGTIARSTVSHDWPWGVKAAHASLDGLWPGKNASRARQTGEEPSEPPQ